MGERDRFPMCGWMSAEPSAGFYFVRQRLFCLKNGPDCFAFAAERKQQEESLGADDQLSFDPSV